MQPTPIDHHLQLRLVEIARQAGTIAAGYFASVRSAIGCGEHGIKVSIKSDQTLLSEADTELDAYLGEALRALTPEIPVISEECKQLDYSTRQNWKRVWLVDPLDGTLHFVNGKPDYSINIALVESGKPLLGVVYAPSRLRCYTALRGQGAWLELHSEIDKFNLCRQIYTSKVHLPWLQVMVSHGIPGSRLRGFLSQHKAWQLHTLGSALKTCWIAEGLADVYPRFGRTFEWDTAAAQVILEEAGGEIIDDNGMPLTYNKPQLANPEFIAASGWYQLPNCWY